MQQPTIAQKPPLTIVGMERSFIHSQSPDANNMQVLGELWREFPGRAREIPYRVGDAMYGVIYERPKGERKHPHELQYIAGVAVSAGDSPGDGFVARTIPAATFAVFLHRGPINKIGATVREIYREWLPASPYQHSGALDVELYDKRFCADSADSEMEYWISIKAK